MVLHVSNAPQALIKQSMVHLHVLPASRANMLIWRAQLSVLLVAATPFLPSGVLVLRTAPAMPASQVLQVPALHARWVLIKRFQGLRFVAFVMLAHTQMQQDK